MEKKNKRKNPYIAPMLYEAGSFCIAILFFFLLYRVKGIGSAVTKLSRILRPFIIGFAIAYLLTPVCRFFERLFARLTGGRLEKLQKVAGIVCSFAVFILAFYILLSLIVPQMYYSILTLKNTLPQGLMQLQQSIQTHLEDRPDLVAQLDTVYSTAAKNFETWTDQKLLPELSTLVGGVGSGVLSVVISIKDILVGLVVAVYALAARKSIKKDMGLFLYSAVPGKWADVIVEECKFADRMFSGFLSGKALDSLIIGIICYVFCEVTAMPSALLVSTIIGVTNFIPFFGPFIGAVPAAFIVLIEDPMKCLWFLLFVIALQQVDGNIIGPKILGDNTGLSGFAVLFAIVLFGGLFGFVGMVIGVPLFAVICDILSKIVYLGLKRNGRAYMVVPEASSALQEEEPLQEQPE